MGRTSKFSFPLPGRRHAAVKEIIPTPFAPSSNAGPSLSKAQRVLGTGDLNIGSPIKEEEVSWKCPPSRSSRISISISESTNDNESVHESFAERWENESGIYPKGKRLHGKASSTLLGQTYHAESNATASSVGRRLQHEDSSSTMKSHYDRQKSPLSISQQTSASSTRDAALRKGFPPVIQRSPLLQVEASIDPYEVQFTQVVRPATKGSDRGMDKATGKRNRRKKPVKLQLDLSLLFPRPRRHGGKSPDSASSMLSTSSMSTNASHTPSEPARSKKLSKSKTKSKESFQSQGMSIRTNDTRGSESQRQATSNLYNLHDHYEQGIASPRMSQIPESRVPSNRAASQRNKEDIMLFRHDSSATRLTIHSKKPSIGTNPGTPGREPFSWKNVRSSLAPQGRDVPAMPFPQRTAAKPASITSRASKTSKTSRHTSASGISNSDLQLKSVLSLSSDSEEDNWEQDDAMRNAGMSNGGSGWGQSKGLSHGMRERTREDRSYQLPPTGGLSPRSQASERPSGSFTVQGAAHLAVPGNYSAPLSPPWTEPREDSSGSSLNYQTHRKKPSQPKEKKSSKKSSSLASVRSSHPQQPTPPLSPTSMDLGEISERASRFMAVTRQEEALLEALRMKRARMKEKIIEEHEIRKSPPRSHGRANDGYLEPSSLNTPHSLPDERQRILRYLDSPQPKPRRPAEPLPELNDFLNFGSNDSTPRASFAAPMAKVRAETTPRIRNHNAPRTPPSSVRLSAVGVEDFNTRQPENRRKKRSNEGVRFAEDTKPQSHQGYLVDEETEFMYSY
ncbi:hypothetical protein GLAREA_04548 [Glarea lozoyensis ATCC 20868]|uniref:Uncharacterized protein n=1 Tax=Glarea lozoyensis (strain ATCC 20868 / MF5171) TaxID=1116229 RepID=S3CMQ0_GLAL2|nr:uncharacterized protein GLAREA_04548 [Glarea lozoyensis ATCC 20868]EPE27757.1 hypothetical protein GLAREA_04548 [Glarea lozoyensis ATCC 20868]